MRLASKVISFLFHPMLMATIGMYLILNIGPLSSILGADGKRLIYLIVFFSTAVLPVSLLPLFYQFGVIKSFQMESSRERVVPVMMTAFFYFLGYLLLKRLGVTGLIAGFMQATVIATIGAGLVSYYWKISMHTIGIGGLAAATYAMSIHYSVDLSWILALIFLLAGLVGSARLYLGAHKPSQVYAGFLWGFLIVLGALI
jgi:membrane-associated phospholipid phosphatase